jgi:hypothetical protein
MKCLLTSLVLCQLAFAQGYDTPLTIQGLDHNTLQSAGSRAAGGITIGIHGDPAMMFANPASLGGLTGIRLSLGAQQQFTNAIQIQEYGPLKYYSNFSLLMEGRTGEIPDPDSIGPNPNAGDTVQRPYDAIPPNWSRAKDRALPLQALVAVPFTFGDIPFVVGAGAVQYADLHQYYQNNNVLTPSILSERPLPTLRPPNDSLPIIAQWSQYTRLREGSVRGYGLALAGEIPGENITVGVSGMILNGSTDDLEESIARGRLTFYTNYFRLDSVYGRRRNAGTSDYSGAEFTFSGIYRGKYLSLGVTVRPPTPITRTYALQLSTDTTGTAAMTTVNGEDRLTLPWRGTAGLSLTLSQEVTLGLEYELRSYASATYRRPDGSETQPWLSTSVFHAGVVYTPASWLTLRGGVRGQAEVFEPEGNPIAGEPVSYSIYSGGCGLAWSGIRLDITYEYASMKYQDVWGSAISSNTDRRHTIVAQVAYELPQSW